MATISQGGRTYDTNNQSDRADLRKSGYYIDNTGVYSPGGNGSKNGQRVGDTFNAGGGFANGAHQNNEAPNNVYLPLKNGIPQSPLSAQTADRPLMPGEVPLSSPDFSSLFGPGSYFFGTGGPSNYAWMQGAAGASNSNDFMSAISNYLNGVQNAGAQGQQTFNAAQTSGNNYTPQTTNFTRANPASAPAFSGGGPSLNNADYLMMLRQLYPSQYGAGSLTQRMP